ncbi:MAG: sulfatase-like hydrolase/transferase [Prolixibacteraceae bacterium]|nr:sulfatase-like hydrolase/transferase [Prolixibacteraceae bacterium]MBT6766640.1 sulfatase-like hydrolase/transferase [Prolixibacteraceae bacterium]MBT7394921.1 sulfatase-like hydrolase/transferase [Prolixibacteraceae bacterium]
MGKSSGQQNVLLIIADDLGIDYSPNYNSPLDLPPTPTLDKLIEEGVLFENVWANPLCSPTRSSILFGRYGFRTGVGAPVGGADKPGPSLNEYSLSKTISELSVHEYSTASVGKWHLSTNKNGDINHPNLVGFNHFSGNLKGDVLDYFDYEKVVNGETRQVLNYASTETVNDAISWLGEQNNPWFLWLAFNAVHIPFHKPPDSLHSYDYLPETIGDDDDPTPYFKAAIEAMDTEMGRLLNYLKASGEYENTNIIYIGDNGTPIKVTQQPFVKAHSKGTLYEGGIHVPMVVSGPAVINKGRTTNALIGVLDIFETVANLVEIPVESNFPNTVDSKSFIEILENNSNVHRNFLYSELFGNDKDNGTTVRNMDYHLIIFENETEEFYHLPSDIYERNNLLDFELSEEQQTNYILLKENIKSIKNPATILQDLSNNIHEFTIEKYDNNSYIFEFAKNHLKGELTIYDLSGRVLHKRKIESTRNRIYLPQKSQSKIAIIENNGLTSTKKFN